MTSVPPMAAGRQAVSRAGAAGTALREAVASELGEGLASSGFLVLLSMLGGLRPGRRAR